MCSSELGGAENEDREDLGAEGQAKESKKEGTDEYRAGEKKEEDKRKEGERRKEGKRMKGRREERRERREKGRRKEERGSKGKNIANAAPEALLFPPLLNSPAILAPISLYH